MHDNAVPRSVPNYVQARWTTSEHADWCMNMRTGDALNSAESDASAWSRRWPEPGRGAGLREVNARCIGGASPVGGGQ